MIIHVRVVPNSRVEKVEKISETEFRIKIMEKPIGGRANARIAEIIAEEFGVARKNVVIKNPNSRKKIVEIKDIKV
jgi:uncharacterized protein YggU (UPF0235/DUF167 family)